MNLEAGLERSPQPEADEHGDLPFVSVIVPVRNEAGYIGPCLEALAAQDYPREHFEVIVLDGESTDGTLEEAAVVAGQLGVPDVFLTNRQHTTATAMNQGISMARGEIVIKVDGHTRIDPSFISASVKALQSSGADAVGGPIRTQAHGAIGQAIALAMSSRFGVGDTAFRVSQQEQWAESVPYGAYRRDVFERIGGFAEDIDRGEDDELNYRLRKAGGRILLTPSIGSVFYARSGYGGLARQYWGYGLAKVEVLRRHPSRLRLRHLVPPVFVLALGVGALLSLVDGRFGWFAAGVGGAYVAANLGASLYVAARRGPQVQKALGAVVALSREEDSSPPLQAARRNWRSLPYLPLAFATIHVAAGAGMLAGIVRALRPRRRANV